MTKSIADFDYEIDVSGYAVFPDIVPDALLARLRSDFPMRQQVCRDWQHKGGMPTGMEGAAHHLVGGNDSFAEFLSSLFLDEYIKAYFEGEYILNSYGALNNVPYSANAYKHGHRFHRDVRTYSNGFSMMLNMLVMVDDFTLENGATKLVPGSHHVVDRPTDAYLEEHAVRALGRGGSVMLFDSNLWHSAAPNLTANPRMALTLTFTRPFFKQQMDYPRMLGENYPVNERMRQLLGYNSRVPCGYEEWYQPPEKRMYKPGQG